MRARQAYIRSMPARSASAVLWFAAALILMVASQLMRLQQVAPAGWLFWDYAGRLGALLVLAVFPITRALAFRHETLPYARWPAVPTIVVWLVLICWVLSGLPMRAIDQAIPGTQIGAYPVLKGGLHVFDLVAGIALVAYHEEVVFRRLASQVFQGWLGDGWAMVAVTSLLFAAYHWWTGIPNVCMAFVVGALLMLAYKHLRALWPAVVAHYLMDVVAFT
jgi:membrane protease YdiL (CAAX protease family)